MNKYFTAKDYLTLRQEYKKLALLHHPDRGGNTQTMQEINAEYERLSKILINAEPTFTQQRKDFEYNASEAIVEKINEIAYLPNIEIEICGSWVWVTGQTREVKEELKKAGFKFSGNKLAWYFHLDGYRKHNNKRFELDDIREMWGSTRVNSNYRKELKTA